MAFRKLIYPLWGVSWPRRCLTFFDAPMEVLLPAGMDIFLLGCKTHDSEVRLTRFFLRNIRTGDTFIDVGAHFGFFTLLAAKLAGAPGKVAAFEPGESTYSVLSRNTQALVQVQIFQMAVGRARGSLTFWEFPPLFSEYNTSNPKAVPAHLKGCQRVLPATSLDTFTAEAGWRPRWIKIDVEGAEWDVVQGMQGLLDSPEPPVIAMEYLGGESHRRALEFLFAKGFTAHVPDHSGELAPCPDPDTWLQSQGIDSENLIFLRLLPIQPQQL